MKTDKTKRSCRMIWSWLYDEIGGQAAFNAGWVQNHILSCPRCRRRVSQASVVNLALMLVRSQPHSLDLLMRANAKAIGVLKRSLRCQPKAKKLKTIVPEPKLAERLGKYKHSVANVAACLALLYLTKQGVFSSMDKFRSQGHRALKQYYANNVGQELADEIFRV